MLLSPLPRLWLSLIRVVSPIAGAVLVAHAAGVSGDLRWIGGLALVGILFQHAAHGRPSRDDEA